MKTKPYLLALGLLLAGIATRGDVITDWNRIAVPLIRKSPNVTATRHLALVHVAMFDAVNAVTGQYTSYAVNLAAPGASPEAAAARAAHDVLVRLFPAEQSALDGSLTTSLATLPDGAAKDSGLTLGAFAATQIWNLHASDGTSLSLSNAFPAGPGLYQPTPGGPPAPVSQQYAFATPWVLKGASQFRPGPPPALDSAQWATDFNEIKRLGSTNSTERTPEQTDIGLYIIDLPHYLVNEILQQVIATNKPSLVESARAFALIHLASADAGIAVWDAKYAYNFWRPVTAIRSADIDGNDSTSPQEDWLPLRPTPGHPEYPCAHCTISAAMCGVLTALFGDDFTFTLESQSLPGKPRTFQKFSEYAALSLEGRLYAGFHYRNSSVVGLDLGVQIGNYVVNHCLMPGPALTGQLAAGEFRLTTGGANLFKQRLEMSPNLLNWSPLTHFTRTDLTVQAVDQDASGAAKFYRAVAP